MTASSKNRKPQIQDARPPLIRIYSQHLPTACYDTNHDTKPDTEAEGRSQVIEILVELVGIEPTTSSLRTMRSPS